MKIKMNETIIIALIGVIAVILIKLMWVLTDPILFWEKLATVQTGCTITFLLYLLIKYDLKQRYER